MTASAEHPKVFISYSWSRVEHEKFVLELATALRSNGVDAILDKWRLKAGQDKYKFMESMVTDTAVAKVLILCDRKYKEKADARTGGVGTESQIISQELYSQVDQTKFIPVLCERGENGEDFLPVFVKTRIYVDMSSDEKYGEGLDELLRLIFDQPLHPEPQLGGAPAYLVRNDAIGGLPVAKELPATTRAIREGKPNRDGLERLFIASLMTQVEGQYVQPEPDEGYDEPVHQAILSTKGLRDQFSDYAEAVAAFSADDPKSVRPTTILLEQLGQKFGPPTQNGRFAPGWADVYRFFSLETALIMTAALIRHERWQSLSRFTTFPYTIRSSNGTNFTTDVTAFDVTVVSQDQHRNSRMQARRVSLSADLLKERCSLDHTSFQELVQADVFLALYSVAHAQDAEDGRRHRYWVPRTTVYTSISEGTMPLFAKAADAEIKAGILKGIAVAGSADLKARIDAAVAAGHNISRLGARDFSDFDFIQATNLNTLVK